MISPYLHKTMPSMLFRFCGSCLQGLSIMPSSLSIYSMLVISVMELRLIAALYRIDSHMQQIMNSAPISGMWVECFNFKVIKQNKTKYMLTTISSIIMIKEDKTFK